MVGQVLGTSKAADWIIQSRTAILSKISLPRHDILDAVAFRGKGAKC